MSLKEILTAAFAESGQEVINQFFWSEATDESIYDGYLEGESREVFQNLQNQGVEFKHEDSYGGEGMGDQYWSLYSFTNKEGEKVHVQFDGWYQSYNGSEFTEWFFVEPKQVTVTKFTRIK